MHNKTKREEIELIKCVNQLYMISYYYCLNKARNINFKLERMIKRV